MWVFCGGMPRSGSTLQFQLTAHLVEQAGLGRRVEWVGRDDFPRLREKYLRQGGWKVLKTHVCTADVQAEFAAGNATGVYVFRDLRDVVVSRMRKRAEPFEDVWKAGLLDRLLTGFEQWTRLPGVLVSRYDAMVADVAGEVGRIAAHLGIALAREDCEHIAADYTPARQRERIQEAAASGRLQHAAGVTYDPVSNLHVGHIRSGQSGEWRAALAPEEVAMIEDRAQRWLVANGYALSLPAWQRRLLKLRYSWRQRRTRGRGTPQA